MRESPVTPTNWVFETTYPNLTRFLSSWNAEKNEWTERIAHAHGESEYGGLFYQTRGASQIVRAFAEGSWNDTGVEIVNYMGLYTPKACAPELKCPETTAGTAPPENGNEAAYKQVTTGPGFKCTEGESPEECSLIKKVKEHTYTANHLTRAYVEISQEKGPELSFNTTSSTIYNEKTKEYIPNVLYGGGGWLGPHSGAFEVKAKDNGIGLEEYRVLTSGWSDYKYYYWDGECLGIQCPEHNNQGYVYKVGMHDGEDNFEAFAKDAAGLYNAIYPEKIKVDATPPRAIKVSGFQNGNELPQGEPHMKMEATDGEGATPSSGVKSLTVSVDGHEVSGSAASCSPGPCTASTELTLATRAYTSGQHSLVVTATDNANNVAQEEYTFRVHGASPVAVGPGSVDPSSGQFTLNATDVSLGGTNNVSRTYTSRNLTAGAEGPLGPQWAMNIGGGEGLTILQEGSAVLAASGGARTTFTRNEKGEFESPKGDSNLKLEAKEKEPGKGISEYVLSDATAATKTKFEQPAGLQSSSPSPGSSFGFEAGQLNHPVADTIDSSNDVWAISAQSDLLEKFSPAGDLLATYGSQGTAERQFISPSGVAVDPRNNNLYISDQGNNRVQELSSSGSFIKMFGWGVIDGKAEFEICTKECKPGISGAGNGQFASVDGVSLDSSGNVWVADYGNNRVQEFNEKGEYQKKFGTTGKGAEQFEGPTAIAFSGSNLYITDYNNNRVQEFSSAGVHVGQFGEGGAENGKFSGPYGIASDQRTGDLYVVDSGHSRVQEFTAGGSFLSKFGSAGTGPGQFTSPQGIAVNSAGAIYVVDNGANAVDEWSRPLWMPTEAGGPLAASTTTYAYTTVEEEGQAVVQPTEALAPIPVGVSSCTPLVRGCRSLTFQYASETKATGENLSEWGEYKGHLNKVVFHAYNPATKEMAATAIAEYAYDAKGRLRAEWDPRISPALKTTYGYDAEGHVTALTAPGQQPWAFTLGTIAGDPNTGRLLKVTQAHPKMGESEAEVKAKLNEQKELAKNTEAPKLSGSTVVGVTMGASSGAWTNRPVVYTYQWEDCTPHVLGGKITWSCNPILGATNPNYKLQAGDAGFSVAVKVTAVNSGGSISALTEHSTQVASSGSESVEGEHYPPGPGSTIEYHVPVSGSGAPYALGKAEVEKWGQKEQSDPVEGMAIIAPDEPQGWPASAYTRATIDYMNARGLTVNVAAPTGGISTSEYNESSETTRTLSADNRAAALKEGCESIEKCKSAEVAEKLDTKTEYSPEGSQILKVTGPEHKVKLSIGAEVQARAVSHDYYNEGAGEVESKTNETYDLLTKTTNGALLSTGEEKDVRTTITSYSGQKDLGWKLRKPTSVIADPTGLNLRHITEYDPSTGNVVETKSPAATSEAIAPPSFSASFGSEGSGGGQFKRPVSVALDASGNEWVVDKENNRIEKFSPSGVFIEALGWGVSNGEAKYETCTSSCLAGIAGTGSRQFSSPWSIAINQSTGNVYVGDSENNRIEELSSSGEFIETLGWGVTDGKAEPEICKASCKGGIGGSGNGQLSYPRGFALDSQGDIWVADERNNRVQEFSSSGSYIARFGGKGSGEGQFVEPLDVTISEGELYVLDRGNNRVEEFSMGGVFLAQFGGSGTGPGQFKEPGGVATNPNTGNIYVSDTHNERVQEFSPAGKFLVEFGIDGTSKGLMNSPTGMTISPTGVLYIANEYDYRVDEWIAPEARSTRQVYSTQFGTLGSGHEQFSNPVAAAVDGHGNIWASDQSNNRIEELSSSGKYIAAYGTHGSGEVQFSGPHGIAINQSTGNVYVSDGWNNRIEELSSSGAFIRSWGSEGTENGKFKTSGGITIDSSGNVWVTDIGNSRIQEFSSEGAFIASYGSFGTENRQFEWPEGITFAAGHIYVSDGGNDRVQELTTSGAYVTQFGGEGNASGQFKQPVGITPDSAGNLYVVDKGHNRIEEFNSSGTFLATVGSLGTGDGQLSGPQGIAVNAAGSVYVADSANNRIEQWIPANEAAHDTKIIYYTAKGEAEVAACREHPEWAGLQCETTPAAQPENGLPELPVITVSYNIWDQVEVSTEKFGSTTRTKTQTFDGAGRALTSETTSSPATDVSLPKVTNTYNAESGGLEAQSATIEGTTKTITGKHNTLGQLTEYVDADGNVAKYSYEEGSDGRLMEVSEGKGEEAASKQTYSYEPTTGFMSKLIDSAAGAFTASYDVEGKMLTEHYPNGMTAGYVYDQTGAATGIEYVKNTGCASKCPETWFSDTTLASVHGETLQQTSTLAKENYVYDSLGRLSETQETPAGKGCTTRIYAYDEESNRTSLTTRQPGSEGKCATEGGATERHTYDEANRLTDEGVTYETFGNTTKLPASDAGGGEEATHKLTSTYYVDSQIATQEQNEKAIAYGYDPAGRTRKTETTVKGKLESTTISHYAGAGEALTWTSEGSGKWTRNVPGIDGTLSAIQTSSGTTTLQLHDLQGDIVATASLSESETKLLSTYNSTEFGVPTTSSPPKYSWLGAGGIASELTSSGVSTQGGASYVPEIGRPLQTGSIASPGSFPDGTGGVGVVQAINPQSTVNQLKEIARQNVASREEAKRREAEELARLTEPPLSATHVDGPGEGNCEVNCVTVIGGEEPTEAEWVRAEAAYDRVEGITGARTASAAGSFKAWVRGVANEGSKVLNSLYEHASFNWDAPIKQAKKNWEFFLDLFQPEGLIESGLSCYKKGGESAEEINETTPPPYNKLFVPVGVVLGCVDGALGG